MAANSLAVRGIRRSLLDTRWASRASTRPITTVSYEPNIEAVPAPLLRNRAHPIPARDLPTTPKRQTIKRTLPRHRKHPLPPPPPISNEPQSAPPKPKAPYIDANIDPSVKEMLPLLKSQPPHYARIHIHGKPYLITAGDSIRLPFLMNGVNPGDVLRLNRATLLGSRDYTLKAGAPAHWKETKFLDERLFTCRARVMGVEMEPMRIKEKTVRRRRHVKTVKSKHSYTILRIMELAVSDSAALEKPVNVPAQFEGEIVKADAGRETVPNAIEAAVKEIIEQDDKRGIEELVDKTGKIEV